MKIKVLIAVSLLLLLCGCDSSFNGCMDMCIEHNNGYGDSCAFGMCWYNDRNLVDETVERACFDECKGVN